MFWLTAHKRTWRLLFLVLLIAGIYGPWGFDRIHVPSPYPCSLPNIRLDENFCGLPLSITWGFTETIRGILTVAAAESMNMMGLARLILSSFTHFTLILLLFALPIITALILILRGDRPYWRIAHMIFLGLTAGLILFALILMPYPRMLGVLWGISVYLGATAGMLLVEALTWANQKSI